MTAPPGRGIANVRHDKCWLRRTGMSATSLTASLHARFSSKVSSVGAAILRRVSGLSRSTSGCRCDLKFFYFAGAIIFALSFDGEMRRMPNSVDCVA
jgi:hypothetical protein